MIVSLSSRGIGAVAFAVGLLLAGCSSEKDVPPTVASAGTGGTQMNTDTGTGGSFPDVNTVPNQRPTSTIQDLNKAPQGLSGAQSGTQYGAPLVGGPTSSAQPPAPPPPPPPEQKLAPIAEEPNQTQASSAPAAPAPTPAPAPAEASSEPAPAAAAPAPEPAPEAIPTPEVAEPQPQENQTQPAPQTAEAVPSPQPQGEGQTIQGSAPSETTDDAAQPAPMAAAPQPEPQPQPAAPTEASQYGAEQSQPQSQIAVVPNPASQPQAPTTAYASNYAPSSPEAYGISPPNSSLDQPYRAPANYAPAPQAPTYATYGQPKYGGQPVALIYFDEGSSGLGPDDQSVLQQIAGMQRAYGGVVHIVGHASTGTGASQQANQRVSQARAAAVAQQLVSYGVPPGAIQTVAAGDSQPLFSETAPSGEAANRRAEVYLSAY